MAGKHDIQFFENHAFIETYFYKDETDTAINVTGYTAELVIGDGTSVITASSTTGEITVTGLTGRFDVEIPAADSDGLGGKTYDWLFSVTPPAGEKIALLYGKCRIMKMPG